MDKRIVIDPGKCDGCGICELVCAAGRSGTWHPALSRIKVKKDPIWSLNLPVVCSHCEDAPCGSACLMNIIDKDYSTGLTLRVLSRCIGCRACQVSCPFDACTYDYRSEKVVNCDLCEGRAPECVSCCPTGALRYERAEYFGEEKLKAAARAAIIEEAEPVPDKDTPGLKRSGGVK